MNKTLVIVTGPTAVGKTSFAIALAIHFKTEIISADSRQFFKEMSIGTAKPNSRELAEVKHHFVGHKSITENYDAAQFEKDSLALLNELFKKHDVVILCGGSGLYIDAVCKGFDEMPEIDAKYREEVKTIYEKEGIAKIQSLLKEKDAEYYESVDINNPQRIMRALEVVMATGKPFSSFRKKTVQKRPFSMVKLALNIDRDQLYFKIDSRVDTMISQGLLKEVESLYSFKNHNSMKTVGYSEIIDFIDGKQDFERAVELIKQNSRRYAKRQLTWLRRDEDYHWIHPSEIEKAITIIESSLKEKRIE